MLSPVYYTATKWLQEVKLGFPGGLVVKNLHANAKTQVQFLMREDLICHRATKPMCHNYLACALGSQSHDY